MTVDLLADPVDIRAQSEAAVFLNLKHEAVRMDILLIDILVIQYQQAVIRAVGRLGQRKVMMSVVVSTHLPSRLGGGIAGVACVEFRRDPVDGRTPEHQDLRSITRRHFDCVFERAGDGLKAELDSVSWARVLMPP